MCDVQANTTFSNCPAIDFTSSTGGPIASVTDSNTCSVAYNATAGRRKKRKIPRDVN